MAAGPQRSGRVLPVGCEDEGAVRPLSRRRLSQIHRLRGGGRLRAQRACVRHPDSFRARYRPGASVFEAPRRAVPSQVPSPPSQPRRETPLKDPPSLKEEVRASE
jgi:hypothetical protein